MLKLNFLGLAWVLSSLDPMAYAQSFNQSGLDTGSGTGSNTVTVNGQTYSPNRQAGNQGAGDESAVNQKCEVSGEITSERYGADCNKAQSLATVSQVTNIAGEAITSETTTVTSALSSSSINS
jgi:hypothetical protein